MNPLTDELPEEEKKRLSRVFAALKEGFERVDRFFTPPPPPDMSRAWREIFDR